MHHALSCPDFAALVMSSTAATVLHHRSGMEFIHRYYRVWGNEMVMMKCEMNQRTILREGFQPLVPV